MYRLVFIDCKDGRRLSREPGPWHPDFDVSKRWYDYWLSAGYSPKALRVEQIRVKEDGTSTVSAIDPNHPPGGGKGADLDLASALASMA